MVKQNMKVCCVVFVLVTIYVCTGSCSCDPIPDPPNSVEDYIDNISAHYRNEIKIIESQLVHMELAFGKQLSIVAYNQELAARVGRQLESRMRSIATLNIKSKLCIQHFIGNVTGENVNLENKLRACVETAKASSRNIPDNARTQVKNSRAQLHELINTDLALCRKNNGNNIQKFTDCAREKLKVRELNVQNMIKATNKEIESCVCRADIVARTALECTFIVTLETQSFLSEMVSTINICIGDRLLEIK